MDRVIAEIRDLSEKLEALVTHVLTLTDDVQTMDGLNISEFGITDGLRALANRKGDPAIEEQQVAPDATAPKWGVDTHGSPQA